MYILVLMDYDGLLIRKDDDFIAPTMVNDFLKQRFVSLCFSDEECLRIANFARIHE